jgi:hypothetical protein
MKKIAFLINSEVKILHGTDDEILMTSLEFITKSSSTEYIDVTETYEDDYFYEAFKISNQKLVIDPVKAQEVQRNAWRAARAEKFPILDQQFMIALEKNDTAELARIAAAKQALRDVTKTKLSKSPTTIRSNWPSILQ